MLLIALGVSSLGSPKPLVAQELFTMPEQKVETRWANAENPTGEKGKAAQTNAGRKGSAYAELKAGQSRVLAEATGTSGTVRKIWITIPDRSPKMLRSLRIDMYWDGAKTAAVSAPLGDFFGVGLGRTGVFESALFSSPEGRSFNCFIPMPFRSGMKIVVTNEGANDVPLLFYQVDYTLGDKHGPETLYLHAHFRRENPTKMQQDYTILPKVEGHGRYLGANIGVHADGKTYFNTWWGEGEVKIYLDGDQEWPTLAGTGTEDYIGTGWGEARFVNWYQGAPVADENKQEWTFYRYHVVDPVYFYQDIRVTIQQIGYLVDEARPQIQATKRTLYRAGPGKVAMDTRKGGIFEREDDWSSCVYFYLDKPEDALEPLMSVAERVKGVD
jgi:hypothetical protein